MRRKRVWSIVMGNRLRTGWPRYASLWVVALVLLPVTLLRPYSNEPPIRSDGVGYHIWTHALVQGRVDFGWYIGDPYDAGVFRSPSGTWINKYPPGVALVRLPFMLPFVLDADHNTITRGEHWMALLLGAGALLGVCALMLATVRRLGVANRYAHLAVLMLTFGTGLFHYATYDAAFSHIYSALGFALLIWFGVRAFQANRALPVMPTMATVALLVLIRNTNGFAVVLGSACFAWYTWHRVRPPQRVWCWNTVTVGGGLLVGAGAQIALNVATQGKVTLSSYGAESFLWDRPMAWSVLVSYERGLFVYYPVLAVVIVGSGSRRATFLPTFFFVGLILVYAFLYGYWHSWMLGGGFGHRGFVEFVPWACPLLALALQHCSHQRTLVAVGIGCASLTLCLMGGYWRGYIPDIGTTSAVYWQNLFRVDHLVHMWGDAKW